ncbi:Hsp70 family protein [Pyxidicoccus caerfyrddinensis]|uniref:Hsp70 family protein n=1 Tax=Pyxidicoccus caerfyrddinensis TaxID=2709663 RepID=UPI0013DB4144|nr:Hsp70 family protein [Pyxidicoccus caerfyrddinensis]
MRTTLDYGIDLGTTNSAIARQDGSSTRLLQGPHGGVLLPSALYVPAEGTLRVGAAAHDAAQADPQNAAIEFKRLMGTEETRTFPASGRRLSPEEMSAEVLRELIGWAAREEEAPRAAVITIPAMFQLPQSEATRRAAQLAGIQHAPLLQEPIAAAIAHSGAGEVREGYWLVYDLGGGTFDVSLVRSRGGRLQVLDHDGDNHLGGRDFDRVVARRAADRVREEGRLGGFKRSDEALSGAFSRLKAEAERVRILLSKQDQAEFRVDQLAQVGGAWAGVSFPLDRGELESLIGSTVRRTTALCKRLLARNRLGAKELKGLVLVGGPTLTPCVPKLIQEELQLEARHAGDPMTMVATGAAIFASTQKLPANLRSARAGSVPAVELQLEFEPMTTDPEPLVVGRVDPARLPAGVAVTAVREGGGFTSAPARVDAQGRFALELALNPNSLNVFALELRSAGGEVLAAEPSRLTLLHGFSVAKPPLSQSVGVMLAGNAVSWYLRKGATLPARNTVTHATTIALRRGQSGEAVNIPLLQGESGQADRNKVIGILRIVADKIGRDLPAGTEVEVTLSIDESSQTTGRAYVPLLDQWFDDVVMFRMETKQATEVSKGLGAQKERLARLEQLAAELEGGDSAPADQRVQEVEALIEEGDRDSIDLADSMVRLMSEELDQTETVTRGRALEGRFQQLLAAVSELIAKEGDKADKAQVRALGDEFARAMQQGDMELAEAKVEDLRALYFRVAQRTPDFWIGLFNHLAGRMQELDLLSRARDALVRGSTAIKKQDYDILAAVCRELMAMLPEQEQVGSSIISHVK